ncbi:NAD-dependent epimerase/dehydratase family protein [Thermodesulfobacteriota bacterium]
MNFRSTLKNARVLVTGGGGFLGKALIKRLLGYTSNIRSLSRNLYQELDVLGIEQTQGDIRDPAVVKHACRERNIVFHVAAKTGGMWGPYQGFHETNVVGTRHIIEACKQQEIVYLIHTSSPSVIYDGDADMMGVDESVPYPGRYQTSYQKTKAQAERLVIQACEEDVVQAIILRPHLIWGPGDTHFVPRIIKQAKTLRRVGDGKNRIDTTYIDNAVQAHILAAEKLMANQQLSGRIYFISQGEPIYLWDMVNHLLAAAGQHPVKKSIPKGLAYAIGWVLECVYKGLGIASEPRMTRFLANELSRSHWFDISAAKRDLGYVPEVSLTEGLKQLKDWMKTWN